MLKRFAQHPHIDHLVGLELSPVRVAAAVALALHLIAEQAEFTVRNTIGMRFNTAVMPFIVEADELLFKNGLADFIFFLIAFILVCLFN